MSYCGVEEVRSLEDALGATCGRSGTTRCTDCGIWLCSAHAGQCNLCREIFCPSCVSFHENEHAKPAAAGRVGEHRRRSA